jgi:hypothetical protein
MVSILSTDHALFHFCVIYPSSTLCIVSFVSCCQPFRSQADEMPCLLHRPGVTDSLGAKLGHSRSMAVLKKKLRQKGGHRKIHNEEIHDL